MDAHLIKNIITSQDFQVLNLIYRSNNKQNSLKRTLLKFNLGPEARIDTEFNFNIWCQPQTDGAGDFSLINKIGKELKSYGIENTKLNFIIGVRNFVTFLRELTTFVQSIGRFNELVREIQAKIVEVIPQMRNIEEVLTLLRLSRPNFTNPDSKIKNINYQIPTVPLVPPEGVFNKNTNFKLLEDLKILIDRINFKSDREKIRSDLEGDKFGTFIPFIFSRIIKEFPQANIYIFDVDNKNFENRVIEGPEVNPFYSQIIENCRFDGQNEKTINLQLLPSVPTLNNIKIFHRCNNNKVFYLNEGGNNVLTDERGNYYDHCMGIGDKSLGIFKANTDETREVLLGYLNNIVQGFILEGETQITRYHIAYVGQTLSYEIDKNMEGKKIGEPEYQEDEHRNAIFNIQRVFLFFKLLKKKYLTVEGQTIHIFILNVFKKILEIYNSQLPTVFPEYNPMDNTFRVNPTTVLKIKFFERIEQEKFIAFIKHSEPILYSTGDQSYQEALSLGKLVFHDYYDHRIEMVNRLLNCYDTFFDITNNYKQFLFTHLRRKSDIGYILGMTFDTDIRDFFGNDAMLQSLNRCLLDYFNDNEINTRFYNFFMKHYDFSKEFKKIIFLMQNNSLNEAIDNSILISREFDEEFLRVDDASYKKKYLKYKQKYLSLQYKLKGGGIDFIDRVDGSIKLSGLDEERSKHSPIFTSNQRIISEALFKYLNEKAKFKLTMNYLGSPKIVLGSNIIKNLLTGRVLGRGANGIAIQFDDNIVIKVSKMMATNPSIIENEIQNMIELYRNGAGYNFRDNELVKILGVVYMSADYRLIKNFDTSRTHQIEDFNVDLPVAATNNDRIGFVIMERYLGDLQSLNVSRLTNSEKYDIGVQMILQLHTLFSKKYFHTDLHDGNWFYKIENRKYIIRIADYGSETKPDDTRIGVFRLSEVPADKENEKLSSLKSALVAFSNKSLISEAQFFTIIEIQSYTDLLRALIGFLDTNFPPSTENDRLNQALLQSII